MIAIEWTVFLKFASPIIAVSVGFIISRFFSERERLIAFYDYIASHVHNSVVEEREVTHINTHAVVIRNNGNKTATNVRISHNVLPDIKIFPETDYKIKELPEGGKELIIPRITPKKEYTISYLYFPPIRFNDIASSIESDTGPAKIIKVRRQQIYPRWLSSLRVASMILGLITLLYIVFEIGHRVISFIGSIQNLSHTS